MAVGRLNIAAAHSLWITMIDLFSSILYLNIVVSEIQEAIFALCIQRRDDNTNIIRL